MSTPDPTANNGQVQPFDGQQVSWDQIAALLNPPPLDAATASSLLDSQPTPPDLNAVGAAAAASATPPTDQATSDDRAQARAFEQQYISDEQAAQTREDKLTDAEIQNLEQPAPAPPQPDKTPLSNMTPLLMLAAFGGRATKMNAGLMLAATNGIVQGYLQGDQQKFDNAQKQYQDAYQQYRDRQEQQQKIYDTLSKAYEGRPDADLKAWQMAHQMTDDDVAWDQNRLKAQDQMKAAAQALAKNQYEMQEQSWQQRAQMVLKQKAAEAAAKKAAAAAASGQQLSDDQLRVLAQTAVQKGGGDPSFGYGQAGAAARQRYQAIKADEIKKMGGANAAVTAGINTKVRTTEANTVARREGSAVATQAELTRPGGLFDQLTETAKKIDLGSAKTANWLELWSQKHVFANKDVQDYITTLNETRTAATGALSRGGNVTDAVRSVANEMFPDNESYGELQTNIARARKVVSAVVGGNEDVIKAMESGQPLSSLTSLADIQPTSAPSSGWGSASVVK